MVEQDKRAQKATGPLMPAWRLLSCPCPGFRVASEGVGDSELQGLVSNWEERVEYCSWMVPEQSSAWPTFLSQEAGCPKNSLEQWIFL